MYQLAEAKGCLLWFLLAYLPDLDAIEEVFGKIKADNKCHGSDVYLGMCPIKNGSFYQMYNIRQ